MGIDFSQLPYRRGVGLCLFNADGLVLVAERRDKANSWQMPQGGVNPAEDTAVAALREMKEEVGTDNARIVAKHPDMLRYEFPDWLQQRRVHADGAGGVVFRGKYRGQEQEWYALVFQGQDSDIDLSGIHDPETAKNGPEFVSWKWVPLAEAPTLIVPFKKPVYDAMAAGFAPIEAAIKRGDVLPAWNK